MGSLQSERPPGKAGTINVHTGLTDVQAFAELAESRRRGDRSQLRRLIAELLGYGWVVYACEPRQAGRAVR